MTRQRARPPPGISSKLQEMPTETAHSALSEGEGRYMNNLFEALTRLEHERDERFRRERDLHEERVRMEHERRKEKLREEQIREQKRRDEQFEITYRSD